MDLIFNSSIFLLSSQLFVVALLISHFLVFISAREFEIADNLLDLGGYPAGPVIPGPGAASSTVPAEQPNYQFYSGSSSGNNEATINSMHKKEKLILMQNRKVQLLKELKTVDAIIRRELSLSPGAAGAVPKPSVASGLELENRMYSKQRRQASPSAPSVNSNTGVLNEQRRLLHEAEEPDDISSSNISSSNREVLYDDDSNDDNDDVSNDYYNDDNEGSDSEEVMEGMTAGRRSSSNRNSRPPGPINVSPYYNVPAGGYQQQQIKSPRLGYNNYPNQMNKNPSMMMPPNVGFGNNYGGVDNKSRNSNRRDWYTAPSTGGPRYNSGPPAPGFRQQPVGLYRNDNSVGWLPPPQQQASSQICCKDCMTGDITCLANCMRICVGPQQTCARAGQGAYAAFCQRVCPKTMGGYSARMEQYLPIKACEGECAAQVQELCSSFACRDFGCEAPDCLLKAPTMCRIYLG